jgi:hypothetical protein
LLLKAEQAGHEVFYVAPRFTSWDGYVLAYERDKVLERSLLLSPSQIDAQLTAAGEPDGPHRILYDERTSFVCSEAPLLITSFNKWEAARATQVDGMPALDAFPKCAYS